jgi:predicted membrane protein
MAFHFNGHARGNPTAIQAGKLIVKPGDNAIVIEEILGKIQNTL